MVAVALPEISGDTFTVKKAAFSGKGICHGTINIG